MVARAVTLLDSTVGKKAVMGVTGLIMFGFVFAHMVGNLQIFLGPEAINGYAASLRKIHGALWVARAVLLVAIVMHIWALMGLRMRNAAARPIQYAHERKNLATNLSALTMVLSGLGLALYLAYHLAHLTFGYGPGYDHQNVYNNLVYGFQNPVIALIYVLANILLAMHLFHGGSAWLQSLGLNHARYNARVKSAAMVFALAIAAGNVAMPVSVLAGWVKETDKQFCFEELAKTPDECPAKN